MPVSSIPAFIDALVITATAALPDVTVYDGPVSVSLEYDALCIGSFTQDGNTATDQRAIGNIGLGRRRNEDYLVQCQASVWSGNTDPASLSPQRAKCFAIVDSIDSILTAGPSLGDVVLDSYIDAISAYQVEGDPNADPGELASGRIVTVEFAVRVINQLIPS